MRSGYIMDNIRIKKIYEDTELIELQISAEASFVKAFQYCYVQMDDLKRFSKDVLDYVDNCTHGCYVELGSKQVNFTPACSFKFLPSNKFGHLNIEVDIEINDNSERLHRCVFYVKSELGLVESFGRALNYLGEEAIDFEIVLN